jgi:hypothetical protein
LTQGQQKFGSGTLAAVAIVAAACFVAPASGHATTINYTLNATATFGTINAITDDISGTFTFNTANGGSVSNVFITVSNSSGSAIVNFGNAVLGPNNVTLHLPTDTFTGDALILAFAQSLGGNTDKLSPEASATQFAPLGGAASVTGGAVATTPLPAAIPLFASGLGVLGFFGLRRKRTAATVAA